VENLDGDCIKYTPANPNVLVAWYLMASYLYYREDTNILSDTLYDKICVQLLDKWDTIEHQHKFLVDKEQLKAGTGYALDYDSFPSRITSAAKYNMLRLKPREKA